MEQYIVSSNSALEFKLGNYNIIKKKLMLNVVFYICIFNIHFYFQVRKPSDINDAKVAFYPDMTYQVFGNM